MGILRNSNIEILAEYFPNSFIIRLSRQALLFNRDQSLRYDIHSYSVFLHEYWHYLHNISTISSFKSFEIYQMILHYFSKTLLDDVDGIKVSRKGISKGSYELDEHDQLMLKNWNRLNHLIEGSPYRGETELWKFVESFDVLSVNKERVSIELNRATITHGYVVVRLKAIFIDKSEENCDFIFGNTAIQECVSSLIDELVGSDGGELENSNKPAIPYKIAIALMRYVLGDKYHSLSTEIKLKICNISLMMDTPSVEFVDLLNLIAASSTANIEMVFKEVWEKNRDRIKSYIDSMKVDMGSILENNRGRGGIGKAFNYILGHMIVLNEMRLDNPMFDLEMFSNSKFNVDKMNEYIRWCRPPVVIQEYEADSEEERDHIVSFIDDDENHLDQALCILACQIHYLDVHWLRPSLAEGINPIIEDKCPFYTSCQYKIRKEHQEICMKTPWRHSEYEYDDTCWYETAVNSTYALVSLKFKE